MAQISTNIIRRICLSDNFRIAATKSKSQKLQDYEIIVRSLSDCSISLPLNSVLTNDIYVVRTADIHNKIVEILSGDSVVDKIFIIREENTFCIWTALSKNDRDARYSFYKKELEIIRYFSEVEFHFDFHLAESEDVEEFLSSGAKPVWTRR